MKTRSHIILLTASLFLIAHAAQAQSHVFLSNNGMLYDAGAVRLAVDGLFGTEFEEYPPLPDSLRALMRSALGPFAGLDVIMATHRHGDHMSPASMAAHLCASSSTIALVPSDAASDVRASATCQLAPDRIRTGTEPLQIDGILITPVSVPHVGNRWRGLDNRAYVIQGAGGRMVHLGDSDLSEALAAEPIDVLVTPYWNVGEDRFMRLWRQAGEPFLIVVHVPPADRERIRAAVADLGLDAWVPQESMESLDS